MKTPLWCTKPRTLAALALAVLGVLAVRSGAAGRLWAVPAAPPVMAMIDLERLMGGDAGSLEELKSRNKALDAKYKTDFDQRKQWRDDYQALAKRIEQVPQENTDERRKLARQLKEIDGKVDALEAYLAPSLAAERAAILRDLYGRVNEAVAHYCQQNNIDIVIMDDQIMTVPQEPNDRVVQEVITRRKILYANKAKLDITGDILTILNNQFAAGGSRPPAKGGDKKGSKK